MLFFSFNPLLPPRSIHREAGRRFILAFETASAGEGVTCRERPTPKGKKVADVKMLVKQGFARRPSIKSRPRTTIVLDSAWASSMTNTILQPWHLFLTMLAGMVNREQQQAIEYLRTENQILREKLGKKRIMLNDDQRRRLAVKGKSLGRKVLDRVATIVTPDTRMVKNSAEPVVVALVRLAPPQSDRSRERLGFVVRRR